MPKFKLKTIKSVKDRFKVTGRGKVIGYRAGRRHLLAGKRAKLMRKLRRPTTIARVDERKIKALLPYA